MSIMKDDEEEILPVSLSALQHYSYCPRQFALIHIEQIFDENVFTMKGTWAHAIVDEEHVKSSEGNDIVTALPVWSDSYGLVGKCDVVELREGVPKPVEFKHGRRLAHVWDEVQLCGQAICLEEMFNVTIPDGAIFHISSRRRRSVPITSELRHRTLEIAEEVRSLIRNSSVPAAVNDSRCTYCSLQQACMPEQTDERHANGWLEVLSKLGGEESWKK